MAVKQDIPKVLIFDDFKDSVYRDFAQKGAEAAEWEPHVFKDSDLALDEFDASFGALVTALGTGRGMVNVLSGNFPARLLITRSNELKIPIALVSGHPWAYNLIREGSLDIVVPKASTEDIPGAVSGWLSRVALLGTLD